MNNYFLAIAAVIIIINKRINKFKFQPNNKNYNIM